MKIKICGLTHPREAEFLNRNRVDYGGMVVFLPDRRRNVSLETAGEIRHALAPAVKSVAVTISPSLDQLKILEQEGFDRIQIHGRVPEGYESISVPLWKAFQEGQFTELGFWQDACGVTGFVLDAAAPGSGKAFDWSLLKDMESLQKPFFLSGGLSPDNVGEAIAAVHPYGVDVSTGVEKDGMGGKDGSKIGRFVRAVRDAERNPK